ncbi:MAG: ATP-binding cassette domain-containing protein [Minwuiales bacterium]|nr:ATP-binding cassette domain-containing protein [Minwuiales bacterium]
MTAVTVSNLSQSYGAHTVLERINLEVAEHTFCTVVGASGCGKSTFLRLLLGQERPTRGVILFDGKPLAPEPDADRGIVFQKYSVFPHLTVIENLILAAEFERARWTGRLFGRARRRAKADVADMLDAVGLATACNRYPAALSGGMQQRLAIAQALLKKPKVLLLDEPFGALDPGTRADMHDLLLSLWRETRMTVFMVTHDIAEGFKLGTRLIVFDKRRWDPDAPDAYGATVTYDLPLNPAMQPTLPDDLFIESTRT